MQQSFVLKSDLAEILDSTAEAMKLKGAQLFGYLTAVGLLTVSGLPLTDAHRERLDQMTGRFEFIHPELREAQPEQEALPF